MLSSEKKKSTIIHSVLFIVWVGLLILASFKDLDISKALSNENSFIGAFFAVVAEWPAYFITPIATIIFFYNVPNMTSVKSKRIALYITFALLHFAGWFIFFYLAEKLYENMPFEVFFSLAYALMASVVCLYFAKFIDKDLMCRLCKFAVFMVIVLIISRGVVTLMKVIWSRARFRDMLTNGTYEMFTPWFQINGPRKVDGYKLTSFPSGHVTSATNLFVIVCLADIIPSMKKSKTALYIVCSVFVALTMVYRIIFNAHFLSDTLFAVLISYSTFYITKTLFFKNNKYVFGEKVNEHNAVLEINTENN